MACPSSGTSRILQLVKICKFHHSLWARSASDLDKQVCVAIFVHTQIGTAFTEKWFRNHLESLIFEVFSDYIHRSSVPGATMTCTLCNAALLCEIVSQVMSISGNEFLGVYLSSNSRAGDLPKGISTLLTSGYFFLDVWTMTLRSHSLSRLIASSTTCQGNPNSVDFPFMSITAAALVSYFLL